jgi:hypothetical protein
MIRRLTFQFTKRGKHAYDVSNGAIALPFILNNADLIRGYNCGLRRLR